MMPNQYVSHQSANTVVGILMGELSETELNPLQ